MPKIIGLSSPNFNKRDPSIPLQYIVLHYTGMSSGEAALQRLCEVESKVSAHYVIDEDGITYQLVDEAKRAWHAGKSFWRGITDVNSASIGIELVNPGHEFGYREFPAAQINALKQLLKDIIQRNKLNPTSCLLGHSDVAPARKMDPGELFPWKELADSGFGLWPKSEPDDHSHPGYMDYGRLLQTIGYDVSDPQAALLAFQRRYNPANFTANPAPEILEKLNKLARMGINSP